VDEGGFSIGKERQKGGGGGDNQGPSVLRVLVSFENKRAGFVRQPGAECGPESKGQTGGHTSRLAGSKKTHPSQLAGHSMTDWKKKGPGERDGGTGRGDKLKKEENFGTRTR